MGDPAGAGGCSRSDQLAACAQLVWHVRLKTVFADIADDGAVPFGLFVPVADADLAFLPGGGGALVPGGGGALVPGGGGALVPGGGGALVPGGGGAVCAYLTEFLIACL
ncbi:hypothetical protein FA111_30760 [Pseudomonas aeruginosa]|nr:hypothetical protein [Pseudomonas aeruginosa]MCO3905640.1 hypothetical protein [Pseudomonas aeruginosa]